MAGTDLNAITLHLGMMGVRASSLVFDGFILALTWVGTHRVIALGSSNFVLMRDSTCRLQDDYCALMNSEHGALYE